MVLDKRGSFCKEAVANIVLSQAYFFITHFLILLYKVMNIKNQNRLL